MIIGTQTGFIGKYVNVFNAFAIAKDGAWRDTIISRNADSTTFFFFAFCNSSAFISEWNETKRNNRFSSRVLKRTASEILSIFRDRSTLHREFPLFHRLSLFLTRITSTLFLNAREPMTFAWFGSESISDRASSARGVFACSPMYYLRNIVLHANFIFDNLGKL